MIEVEGEGLVVEVGALVIEVVEQVSGPSEGVWVPRKLEVVGSRREVVAEVVDSK